MEDVAKRELNSAITSALFWATKARLFPTDRAILMSLIINATSESNGQLTVTATSKQLTEWAWVNKSHTKEWQDRLQRTGILRGRNPWIIDRARLREVGKYDAKPPYPDEVLNPPKKVKKQKLSDRCPNGNACPMKEIERQEDANAQLVYIDL